MMGYLYFAAYERFCSLAVSTSVGQYLPRIASPLPALSDTQYLCEAACSIEVAES